MKRIVTVIVVWVTFCLMLGVDSQAAAVSTATKDNSQDTIDNLTFNEFNEYSKSNSKKQSKKKVKNKKSKKKKTTAVMKQNSIIAVGNLSEKEDMLNDAVSVGNTDNISVETENVDNEKNEEEIIQVSKIKSTSAVEQKKKASSKKKSYTKQELRYMTCIIYCEARGESYAGQKAVGIVVMNRKRSDEFPNGIKKVIYQRGQFSPVRNGGLDRALALYDKYNENGKFKDEMVSCLKAAKEALEGSTTIKVNGKEKEMKNYLYFSRYISNAKYTLGDHQFK